jgi:hypothetical protein
VKTTFWVNSGAEASYLEVSGLNLSGKRLTLTISVGRRKATITVLLPAKN